MNTNNSKQQMRQNIHAGFTIIEIIATIVIASILLTIILTAYISYNRLFVSESNIADAQKQNIFVMNGITAEIHRAKNILLSRTINNELFTTGTSTIVLAYPVFDSNNELVAGVSDYGAITLDSQNSRVRFSLKADTNSLRTSGEKILGNNVALLLFRYNSVQATSSSNISVTLTTAASSRGSANTLTQTNSVSLRND